MPPIKLIVGLGNPGAEYAQTRHNAGFWFVDELARSAGVSLRHESKFHGLVAKARLDGREVWLLQRVGWAESSPTCRPDPASPATAGLFACQLLPK